MHSDSTQPRLPGSGSLLRTSQPRWRESWYGKWRVEGQQVMRVLGPARSSTRPKGLTRHQAEAALRKAMSKAGRRPNRRPAWKSSGAGARLLEHLNSLGRKRSTLMDYESTLRVHLVPFFEGRTLEEIDLDLVERFVHAEAGRRQSRRRSIHNYLGLLHSIFAHGMKRGWCTANPVAARRQAPLPAEPGHPLSDDRRTRGDPGSDPGHGDGKHRPSGLPHRRDDRHAARRGRRRSLARRRLDRRRRPCPAQLHTRRVRHAEVTPLEPRGSPRRAASRDRTRTALRPHPVQARPRPGLLPTR